MVADVVDAVAVTRPRIRVQGAVAALGAGGADVVG